MHKVEINLEHLEKLKAQDEVLKTYIENSKLPVRYQSETIFIEVVKTIIGQLISTKAAQTIYDRLENLLPVVDEANFIKMDKELIIGCGISEKKYGYILNIAKDLKCGILDFQQIKDKSDEDVIKLLCRYPGIGLWSAEMLMIFALNRPNILAFNDLGIRKGICIIYGLEELSKAEFAVIKARVSPYGTIASFYFWQAYSGE